jgi:hypothetical protein
LTYVQSLFCSVTQIQLIKMEQKPNRNKPTALLSAIMGTAYLAGGSFLIFSSETFDMLPQNGVMRYLLATLLVAYGAFRLYRAKNM